ncbi:siderophore-interacting protein [Kitasatospora sp. NBC_01560]|uniref:siderophore-interacting protein n=1 Tax=Kitasatospora sp. NBC_01560 TaxID=2975965 RepID=UPI003869E64D
MFRRPRPTHDVEVTAVAPLTSALARITLSGPTLADLGCEHPTQWVKLAIPEGPSRAYTIRHHRPAEREVDIDMVLHGSGPLARWASVARPGDRARLGGPRGRRPDVDGAAHVLLAADVPPATVVWLAGESTAVATVRRHLLTDPALPREHVHAKGYWKHGEADHKG